MKTLGRFVLLDNTNKKQLYLEWKTQATLNRYLKNNQPVHMTYSARKSLISGLTPLPKAHSTRSSHHTNIINKDPNNGIEQQLQTKPNNINTTKQVTSASSNHLTPFIYANPQRQHLSHTKSKSKSKFSSSVQNKAFHRTRSMGKMTKTNTFHSYNINTKNQHKNHQIDITKIKQVIAQADKKKGRTIAILKMRRQGLRYKISHNFYPIHSNTTHPQFIKHVKQTIFQQFKSIPDKPVYLFHLSKEPISDILTDINSKQYVIFADVMPKFDLPFQMQMKLFEQASIIQEEIKIYSMQLEIIKNQYDVGEEMGDIQDEGAGEVYQWQKIRDIKGYVDKLVDDPKLAKDMKKQDQQKDNLQTWYAQKYKLDQQKKGQKNPFFDVQCHFPNEVTQTQLLQQAAIRVDYLPTTINKHEIRQKPLQNMMQKIKRQMQNAQKLKKQQTNKIKTLGYKSSKDFFKQLDSKNTLLTYQNIPYIMQKYGVNRAEAYNLYNLYKSLEKVSAMRLFQTNQYRRVKQKGIDRKTFDEGLKGLEINPGDQVIRNICYFPQFITCISMRKTPKSKLEAILQGLGSYDKGYLSIQQISIMVGSSLQKIFGKDEPQLRKYFVSVVMKQLDKDKSGTIQITQLKQHVLEKGLQNLDIVTYLMLNS